MPMPPNIAARVKVNRAKARAALAADPALANVTDAELDAALTGIDQDSLYDTRRAKWTVEVWDRKSPINGVPAEHFLARDDVDENGTDDIYLLIEDGQVVGFQPHEPEAEGLVRIPKGQGKARGGKHADQIAADRSATEVLAKVREKIEQKRRGKP